VVAILALIVALSRPRRPDETTAITVEGRDIVLALDVSGSMQLLDDPRDPRTRWDVARDEARRFIANRTYDPIGLVYFGAFAVSRCPITLDKPLLDGIVRDTNIGDINPKGTMLAQALALSVQRLRHSASTNKIVILVTDGEPSENDLSVNEAISMAQKIGVTVYTIGVGSESGGYFVDPIMGMQHVSHSLNTTLLDYIARTTNGHSFRAHNPAEMKSVYDTIDALEASEHDAPEYSQYYEYFMPCIWLALIVLVCEVCMRTYIWIAI